MNFTLWCSSSELVAFETILFATTYLNWQAVKVMLPPGRFWRPTSSLEASLLNELERTSEKRLFLGALLIELYASLVETQLDLHQQPPAYMR
jgi:hypothetical protein